MFTSWRLNGDWRSARRPRHLATASGNSTALDGRLFWRPIKACFRLFGRKKAISLLPIAITGCNMQLHFHFFASNWQLVQKVHSNTLYHDFFFIPTPFTICLLLVNKACRGWRTVINAAECFSPSLEWIRARLCSRGIKHFCSINKAYCIILLGAFCDVVQLCSPRCYCSWHDYSRDVLAGIILRGIWNLPFLSKEWDRIFALDVDECQMDECQIQVKAPEVIKERKWWF